MPVELIDRCRDYVNRTRTFSTEKTYFLLSKSGYGPLSRKTIYYNFRKFLWDARISHGGKSKGPRVHDFRHSFAVHRLKRWVEEGKDVSSYLPFLTKFLGHTYFHETAYYLRLTADVYPCITEKLEQSLGPLIPMLEPDNEND